jgi:hypothetical protein
MQLVLNNAHLHLPAMIFGHNILEIVHSSDNLKFEFKAEVMFPHLSEQYICFVAHYLYMYICRTLCTLGCSSTPLRGASATSPRCPTRTGGCARQQRSTPPHLLLLLLLLLLLMNRTRVMVALHPLSLLIPLLPSPRRWSWMACPSRSSPSTGIGHSPPSTAAGKHTKDNAAISYVTLLSLHL